ncbi:MAG: hypothetical protein PHE84_10965 [bacterium]|nr:hypothetical protein [bacterium]
MKKAASVCLCLLLLTFGCGSSASHLEKGKAYLEAGLFRPAQVEYYSVINPDNGSDPESCEGHYGFLLSLGSEFVEFGGWMDMIGMKIIPYGDFLPDPSAFPSFSPSLPPLPGSAGPGDSRVSFSPAAVFPNQFQVPPESFDSIIDTFITPTINQFLLPLENSAKFVIENNCRFETAGIPIYINGDTFDSRTMLVGKKFGPAEANLFGAITALQLAVFYYLTSLDFRADPTPYMHLVNKDYTSDLVGFVRQLGPALTGYPDFLNFHATRGVNFNQVAPNLALFFERTAATMRLTFLESENTTAEEAQEHFLGYYDTNGNGLLDSGDKLYLGILDVDPPMSLAFLDSFIDISQYPINVLEKSFVWTVISGNLPEKAEALFLEIRDKLTGANPDLFNLAEINNLLPPGWQILPATFALDLHTLFPPDVSQAKSFREFFPAWGSYDPPGGAGTTLGDQHTVVLLEGELGLAGTPADYLYEVAGSPTDFAYTHGPGLHFPSAVYGPAAGYFSLDSEVKGRLLASTGSDEVVPIPDDCVQMQDVSASFLGVPIPLIYLYWQDPSFNQSLYVNLQSLRSSGGSCELLDAAASSTSWDPATNSWPREDKLLANEYSINKAMNALLNTILPLLGSLSF